MSLPSEEIIRMAMEAGLYDCIVFGRIESKDTVIERFANAAYAAGAAAEREQCLSSENTVALSPALFASIAEWKAYKNGVSSVLDAIRARGNGASHEQD